MRRPSWQDVTVIRVEGDGGWCHVWAMEMPRSGGITETVNKVNEQDTAAFKYDGQGREGSKVTQILASQDWMNFVFVY